MSPNLINCLKIKVMKWIYPRLLSKKCGKLVPVSGESGKKVNCYLVYTFNEDGNLEYLVEKIDVEKGKIYAQSMNDEGVFSIPKTVNLNILFTNKTEVRHFYKKHWMVYHSFFSLFVNYVTKYEIIKVNFGILKDYFFQKNFNRKEIINHKRIDILRFMLNEQLDQTEDSHASQGISCFDLMTKMHSARWINHPNGKRKKYALDFYLESLVNSGDLKKDKTKYRYILTHKALQTIQEYEEEESKHNDLVKIQKNIAWLTFLIAIGTLVSAFKP